MDQEEENLQATMPGTGPTPTLPPPTAGLESIFQAHHGKVFAAAYRITGSAQDAEDVLQTVFLRLLRRSELDLAPSPGRYLHRAAVNASLDLIRARRRARAIPLDDLDAPPDAGAAASPDRRQEDREIRRGLRQAVLDLSAKSAEIFSLRYFEGLGNREIAEMLGASQTAVGVTLHRARNQVRSALRAFVGETQS